MNDALTIKSLAGLALEHDADFEVFHGETTHKDKHVRAQMVLSMNGCPDVRIAFGDKTHGQRVSSITLAGNDKIKVKQEHLLNALERNSATSEWRRVMSRESTVINLTPFGPNNGIAVIAKVVGTPKLVTDATGFYQWHEYEVLIENHVYNPVSRQVVETEPTRFFANIPIANGSPAQFEEGQELKLTGDYVFPDHIEVRSLVKSA